MSEKLISKYEKIFYYQLNYFCSHSKFQFYNNQFKEIVPGINKCLSFVDSNITGEHKELIKMNAIAVIPFMMTKVKIKPHLESRNEYKKALDFLEYIKYNKGMANHLIASTTSNKKDSSSINFDDFYGFDMDKVDVQINTYKHLLSMKKTLKREWFSNVLQLRYLCVNLIKVYGSKESKIIDFLYNFFKEFVEKEVDSDVIKQKIIQTAKKDSFVRLNSFETTLLP